jgi:trigger factor
MSDFQNDKVKVTVKENPNCVVNLVINVAPSLISQAYSQALKAVKKETKIPGFRDGKAPDSMVAQRYPEQVQRQLKDEVANLGFYEAMQLVKIYPYDRETIRNVKVENVSKENGATLSIEYQTFPKTPSVNAKDLKLNKVIPEQVDDEKIDIEIENLRLKESKWSTISDRPVQEGDFVMVDLVGITDKGHFPLMSDRVFMVDKKFAPEWLYPSVIGKNTGDEVDTVIINTDPDTKAEKPSNTAKYTLKEIAVAERPELDDEFAKRHQLESVGELREQIKAYLKKQAEAIAHANEIDQLHQLILDKYSFPLPTRAVEIARNGLVENRIKALKERGIQDTQIEKARKQIALEMTPLAEESVKLFFILEQVLKDQNITFSQEDLKHLDIQNFIEVQKRITKMATLDVQKAALPEMIRIRKADEYLLSNAG